MTARPVLVRALPFCLVSLAAACGAATGAAPAPRPTEAGASDAVRVLVYNIHAGKDAAGADNVERVASLIRGTAADVVVLQEVDRETRRSGGVDQLAVLERLTGLHGAFGRTLDYQGGGYGIAVLSRWPVESDSLIRLPVDPPQARGEGVYDPRGAHAARLGAPGGLAVLNTHLDPSADDRYRRQELETLLEAADRLRAERPFTLMAGDFNAEPGSAVIDRVSGAGWTDAFASCGVGDGGTYPADAPVKRIDYLFLAPGLECERAEVLETTASDHRPLLVTVRRSSVARGVADRLPPDAAEWVDATLAGLTLREKAGQLIMPWVGGDYVARDSEELDRLAEWVERHGIGGVVISVGMPLSYAAKLNALQRRAAVPLLVTSDMENGPGMRMAGIYSLPHLLPQGGGTSFPPVMALGAAKSERLAYELGRVLAREARAVGVHMTFGPVLDVNSNPANPIINTRSFGEDPALVARLGRAYIRGARDAGLMTTAKHFPGHGDTSEDSHLVLPSITADRARMEAVELPPFREAIAEGVDAVMTAHIAVTGVLGPDAPPATLSPWFMTDLLRGDMGFEGLLFTDAMTMGGVVEEFGGGDEVLVRALEAGADVLLMPADVAEAVDAVVAAVEAGRIAEARLDASVRRLLEAKARAGLHRERLVDVAAVDGVVAVRAHTAAAREIAERSLTLARDRTGLVPIRPDHQRILVVSYVERVNPVAGRVFLETLDRLAPEAARVDPRTTDAEWDALRARADSADLVIVTAEMAPREFAGTVDPAGAFGAWVEKLAADGAPVVAVSFGSPYLLDAFPSVPAYLLAWGGADVSQVAAAEALLGLVPIGGRLPISLPPHHPVGTGLERPGPGPGRTARPARAPSD